MTDRPQCISTPNNPFFDSIFTPNFLKQIGERPVDGFCEHEAAFSGPWRVEARDDAFVVVREGDSRPRGIFNHYETACLVAAVLPAVGSDALYAMRASSELVRVIGQAEPTVAGQLSPGAEDIAGALHVAAWFLRSPSSLAFLLEAASHGTLKTAGRLVALRRAAAEGSCG